MNFNSDNVIAKSRGKAVYVTLVIVTHFIIYLCTWVGLTGMVEAKFQICVYNFPCDMTVYVTAFAAGLVCFTILCTVNNVSSTTRTIEFNANQAVEHNFYAALYFFYILPMCIIILYSPCVC